MEISQEIENSKKIAIFAHVNPDADAICSSIAFKNIIKNNFEYKYIDIFLDGEIGDLYKHLIRDEVINPEPLKNYDLAIVLDSPTLLRLGKYSEIAKNTKNIINIDHHDTNERFGTTNLVPKRVSSTCEFLYMIARKLGFTIDDLIAKYLYQGIITDTNCFTTFTTTANTHLVVNELLKFNFDEERIKEHYFKNNSLEKTKMLARALTTLKIIPDTSTAIMKITYDEMQSLGTSFDDTLGIVDSGISIDGVKICAIFIEKEPNKIYVSIRGKGEVNIAEIVKVFNGGGNSVSGAFQFSGSLKEIEKIFINYIKDNVHFDEDIDDEFDLI